MAARAFGSKRLFRDIDTIFAGEDFQDAIDDALLKSKVMLVVIGSQWLTLSARNGRPRISEEDDFVRREIEAALHGNVPVLPIYLQGVEPPSSGQLPATIRKLATTHGFVLRPDPDFPECIKRLIGQISKIIEVDPQPAVGEQINRPTNPADLDTWIRSHTRLVKGAPPYWTFKFSGRDAFASASRRRICRLTGCES